MGPPAALSRTRRRLRAFGATTFRYASAAVFATLFAAGAVVSTGVSLGVSTGRHAAPTKAVVTSFFVSPAAFAGTPTRVVATGARYPVIGCNDTRLPAQNRASWRYAPRACETGGSLGSTEGIAAAHWHHWGSSRAHATGLLIDGLGFAYPARITAFDLVRARRLPGTHRYGSWYARLRVVAARRFRGGIARGPYRVLINVTPQAAPRR